MTKREFYKTKLAEGQDAVVEFNVTESQFNDLVGRELHTIIDSRRVDLSNINYSETPNAAFVCTTTAKLKNMADQKGNIRVALLYTYADPQTQQTEVREFCGSSATVEYIDENTIDGFVII